MTSSADLAYRLKHNPIPIDGSGPLGGWEDVYITPGHTHECHPDFVATPIGDSPFGFLVCQRKKPSLSFTNEPISRVSYTQSHNLYDDTPGAHPSRSRLGGQPLLLFDRREQHHAHLQGTDYYRDPLRFRGIGIEKTETAPGEYGHKEHKYFHSSPPPICDITHAIQPFEIWKSEQLRNGHLSSEEMKDIESNHTFAIKSSTF